MADDTYLVELKVNLDQSVALRDFLSRMKRLGKDSEVAGKAVKNSGKAMNQGSNLYKRFGYQIQNASYQLTDFIVMVQGGISPMRAFSQQAPQLLAGFGPLGAAIGVVAAIIPSLILGVTGSKDALKSLDDVLDDAESSMSAYTKALSDYIKEGTAVARIQMQMNRAIADSDYQDAVDKIKVPDATFWDLIWEKTKGIGMSMASWASSVADSTMEFIRTNEQVDRLFRGLEAQIEAMNRLKAEERAYAAEANKILTSRGTAKIDVPIDDPNGGVAMPAYLEAIEILERLHYLAKESSDNFTKAVPAEVANALRIAQQRVLEYDGVLKEYTDRAFELMATPAMKLERELEEIKRIQDEMGLSGRDAWVLQQKALQDYADALGTLKSFGEQFSEAFIQSFDSLVNGIAQGTSDIKDLFKNMAKALIAQLLKIIIYQQVFQALGGWGTSMGTAFGTKAGVGTPPTTPPVSVPNASSSVDYGGFRFAQGGVINGPVSMRTASGQMGIAGERGAEGIFPLARTAAGDLAVKGSPPIVNIYNSVAGVEVNSTMSQNGQVNLEVVKRAVASDIARGGNLLADSISSAYGIKRGGGLG